MTFQSPHLLWLLVPLVLLFSWELARRSAGAAAALPKVVRAWAGAFQVSLGSRHTTAETRPRIWLWFGLALCVIAAARPQWGVIEEPVFDQSREVLIAVDLSRSMLAPDVKPSRLDRSRLLITSLLDGLKGERVGLVLFAGTAFLQSPLSADYEILREFLPALQPDFLPEGGSNYRAMIETSVQAFGTSTADRYLIVLSDGESTDDTWRELAATLKTKDIRVIGLGVGTTAGAFIPDPAGGFVKDERGAVVLSRLNASTLQELAQTTGGAYADASTWVDLPALLRRTVEAGRQGQFTEKNAARKVERFQWFLAPGLALLLLSFWAEFPVRPRERALRLGKAPTRSAERGTRSAGKVAAALILGAFWLSAVSTPRSALAAEGAETETLAKPLTTTVARLADKAALSAKDCAELAQTTVTFGQRLKSGQQRPPEGVVRDALAAVDLGEKADAKAADWPRLRRELEDLLETPPPPPEQPQDQKQDEQKDQQKNQDPSQNQDQQNQKDQKQDQNQQQPSDPQQSPEQKQEQQKREDQQAFGEMKEPPPPGQEQPQPPPPQPQTQKVGGQKERKPEQPLDPELAVPLQKLDQVRDQDSPAKLQRLMQGQQSRPQKKGKDW
jgi:Ca-activated chloride channel homolog